MNILKRMAAWLCAGLLFFGLLGLAWSTVGHFTVRNKDTVKTWLTEGGVYDNITDTVLETAAKDTSEGRDDFDASNPIIRKAVDDAFSPQVLEQKTERVIDSVYAWLSGETNSLEFEIDLGDAKADFIDAAAGYAAERAAELPTCTSVSQAQDFDPINASCVPPGTTAATVEAEVRNQLAGNDEFFEKTTFSAADIKVGDDKQSLAESEDADRIRQAYSRAGSAPILFGFISALGLVGTVLLSPRKLFGIRRAGGVFVSSGVILGISWIFLRIGQSISTADISTPTDGEAGKSLIAGIVRVVTEDIAQILIWFVIGYVLIGIGMLVWAGMKKRGQESKGSDRDVRSEPTKAAASEGDSSAAVKSSSGRAVKPVAPKPQPRNKIQL